MAAATRVGIIGAGNVGTALTQGLTKAGYEVQTVGKEPAKVREVASWAEVVVLAVPFAERHNALREMGDAAQGKVLVDVTNAVTKEGGFAHDLSKSGAEELQGLASGAKVVKAFNTVFAEHMDKGRLQGERLTVFAAADDPEAKRTAMQMARAIGFDAVDAGPLQNARWLETLAYLNITLGYALDMGPTIGFKLIHPPRGPEGPERKREAAARGR